MRIRRNSRKLPMPLIDICHIILHLLDSSANQKSSCECFISIVSLVTEIWHFAWRTFLDYRWFYIFTISTINVLQKSRKCIYGLYDCPYVETWNLNGSRSKWHVCKSSYELTNSIFQLYEYEVQKIVYSPFLWP